MFPVFCICFFLLNYYIHFILEIQFLSLSLWESSTFFELKHLESCFRDTCGDVFCCHIFILYYFVCVHCTYYSTVSLFVCLRKCHLLCSVCVQLIWNEFSKETIYNVFRKPIPSNLSEFLSKVFSKTSTTNLYLCIEIEVNEESLFIEMIFGEVLWRIHCCRTNDYFKRFYIFLLISPHAFARHSNVSIKSKQKHRLNFFFVYSFCENYVCMFAGLSSFVCFFMSSHWIWISFTVCR